MEQIKKIFKRAGVAAGIILIYGIIIRNEYVYIGMFSGSVMSIIMFYMICMDVKSIAASESVSRKRGFAGYAKRYVVYGVYLAVMAKFFGLPMLLSSAIGLLSVKVIILLMTLSENILKFRDKFLKKMNK